MHRHHFHIIRFLITHKKLSELYTVVGIRGFAVSLINVFLPIYIFLLRNSLEDVAIFYFFVFVAMTIAYPIGGFISSKIGNAHMNLLSAPFGIIFYLAIYFLNPLEIGVIILGLIVGFFDGFFWVFMHTEFSSISDKKMVAKETSWWRFFYGSVNIIGPFIGGLTIVFFGFHTLFIFVAMLLLISPLPLLFSTDIKETSKFNFKEIFSKQHIKLAPAFFGFGATTIAASILWPLFVYFSVPDFLQIGSMSMIVNIISSIIVLMVGWEAVKLGEKRLVRIGSFLFGISVIVRAFVSNVWQALAAWSFGALTYPIVTIPFEAISYSKAKEENITEFFIFREWAMNLGRFTILGIIVFFNSIMPEASMALGATLVLGGFFVMLMATVN